MILVDTNIVIDVVTSDPMWEKWSLGALEEGARLENLVVNDVVYAELSSGYASMAALDAALDALSIGYMPYSKAAMFLAGRAFIAYRTAGGARKSILPDFFIGAHAVIEGVSLLTRDVRRYRTYFPTINLITPD